MRLVKYLSFFAILIALLLGVTLTLLVIFSNTELLKGYMLEKVGNATGATVTTEDLNIQVLSSPHIQLSKLLFIDNTTGKSVFQLESGSCHFEFPLLLTGKIVINHCTLNQPMVTVGRQQDGSWKWLSLPDDEESDGTSLIQFAGLKELAIHNGTITITNKLLPEESRSITLSHLEAMASAQADFNQINFRISATPSDSNGSSKLSLVGHLQGDFSLSSSVAWHSSSVESQYRAAATVDFQDIDIRRILTLVDPEVVLSANLPAGNLHATLTLFPDKAGYSLVAEKFSGRIGELKILGKGSVTGLFSNQPAFFFTGNVPTYPLEKIPQIVPRAWIPPDIHSILQRYIIRGMFDIPQVTIAGALGHKEIPSIFGNLRIAHGFVDPRSNIAPLRNIQTSVTLEHQNLTINEFSAEYETSQIQQARGRIDFQKVDPWLTLTTKGNLWAKDILMTSRQFSALKEHPPLWLKATHVEGHAFVDLTIEGPLSGSSRLQIQQGKVVLEKFAFQFPTQPFPIRAMTGQVRFDQNHLTFDDVSAEYGSSMIKQASGRIEFRIPGPWLAFATNGHLHAEDVLTTVRQLFTDHPSWLNIPNVEGVAAMALMIEGPLNEPEQLTIHRGELRVQNLGLQPVSFPLALQGVSGRINVDQEQVIIHGMKGKVGKSHTTLQGRASYGQRDALKDITLRSQVELSDLQLIFPKLQLANHLSGGPLEIAMRISGSASQPEIHTELDLTSIKVSNPHMLQKPSGISTSLTFDGTLTPNHSLKIRQSSLKIPPFHLDVKGEVSLDDQHRFDLTLTTGADDESILPQGIIVGDKRLGLQRLEGNVRLQGSGNNWPAWKTNGLIDINKSISIAAQTAHDTHHTARVQWTQEHHAVTFRIRAQDIPLETILPEDSKLSGNLSTSLSLDAKLDDAEMLKTSVTGNGEFQINNGHIVHSPVITRILGLLNIPNVLMGKVNFKQQGIPFHSLTGTLTFGQGLITSNDLLLNSPVLKMTAAGNYAMPTDQLNFIFAVSPFGEYSNLLKNIPLFGRLFKGERQGLATALFEAKGPRQHPKVRYLPLKSFTGGLRGLAQFAIDVLKNTVTLPKDLMPKSKNENASSEQ